MKTEDIIKCAAKVEKGSKFASEETAKVLARPVGKEPIAPHSAYGIGFMDGMFTCRSKLKKEIYDNLELLTSLYDVEIKEIVGLIDE